MLAWLCGCLLKPHIVGNSMGKRETWEGNGIRMAIAGEAVRLTEQESGPAFRWCDGKYNNTASDKHQSRGNQPPLGSTCFSSQYPCLYGESADHTMSWILSGFHIYILKMPKEGTLRAESQQLFTLVPSLSLCGFTPAVSHPASWCSSEGPSWLLLALSHSYHSKFCSPATAWPTQCNPKHPSFLTIPLPFSLSL